MRRVLISRITHGLDTPQSVFPVFLTLLWLVTLAVPGVQARVLDFTVEVKEVNQAGPRCTVQANNNTPYWMEGEGSRSTESADDLSDNKPHKSCGIWPGFNTLIESVSWQPLYAREMVVGYRLWLSLQGDSLSIRGFSWWPVVAGVVLEKFVYTWWHSEAPSFDQWEEQQQHRVSGLKIITCMDHPPGQSRYPQGGCGSGVSNQGTGGYNDWGNSFRAYGGYSPPGGGGGGHYSQDGHTHNYRPCPACCQQPCRYPVESNPHYYGQPDSSMNDALALSHYPSGPEVSTNYGDRDWLEYQGSNAMAETTSSSATSSETSRVFTQQEPSVHEPGCLYNKCFPASRKNSGFLSGVESTAISLQSSVPPPAPGWPSDHEPNDPGCVCIRCLDLFIQCVMTNNGQGGYCVAGATSVENSDVSERPTALVSPWVITPRESDVHQQPESAGESELAFRKSRQSSQQKPPGRKWVCSYPDCTRTYSHAQTLREHEASHEGKWTCSYPGCTGSYSNARALKEHKNSHQGKWACSYPDCTKSYNRAQTLREHEASHEGKWACSHSGCTRSYSNSYSLKEHEASHQNKWACSYPGCNKSYSNARGLREHKASHQGKWDCPYPGCTKSYGNAYTLKEHKASHKGKWDCPYPGCTKSYSRAQTLREHKANHEGKRTCSYTGCTKSYSSAQALREHEASHQGK